SDYNCFLHLEEKQQKLHNSDNTLNQTPNAYNAVSTLNIVTSAEANFVAGCQDYILLARATVIIKASDGVSDEFRAILGSASQINIVIICSASMALESFKTGPPTEKMSKRNLQVIHPQRI
uniref:Uncharacterized protein n=1 Tax=Glossina palpalis gambiensis TaxID=67801 RepID=A0A1B0AKQ7_9MUSC